MQVVFRITYIETCWSYMCTSVLFTLLINCIDWLTVFFVHHDPLVFF